MRAYRVAYDGRPYHGFQRQPDVPTVEDAIFDALRELGIEFEDRPPGYAAAGRTDAGVSALAQTVAFDAPSWLSPVAFNSALPDPIRAWATAPAHEDFHATHDAAFREYTYHLHAPGADHGRIEPLEGALSGEHDFHNLSADDEGTVRDLDLVIDPVGPDADSEGEFLRIRATADGFPRQLVRRLVSLIDVVLRGEKSMDAVHRVLDPEPLDGPAGIPPAAAYPLVLTDVGYDLDFERDPEAAGEAKELFSTYETRHRTRARVADTIARGVVRSSPWP